ncbi:MAG: hypothetical protein ACK419_07620, partial [Pyrinomonadaceae bacterium]
MFGFEIKFKTRLKNLASTLAIITVSSAFIYAQTGISTIQPKNEVEEKFKQIAPKVGERFKLGLLKLQKNQRREAKEEFDKAVELFLESRINLRNGSVAEGAGFNHVLDRHFNPSKNASQFTVTPNELKTILQSKEVVSTPVSRV